MKRSLFVCAGEASGDIHGAELLSALKRLDPDVEAFGVGGPQMEAEGFESIVSISEFGQAGLVEVLAHLPRLLELFDKIAAEVEKRRPSAVVLIDFPDFNLRLARRLKRAGLRVVYYVSPQLWAWRKGRIRTIRETVDRMLVLFPFEESFYREAGVAVTWVGHPIVDALASFRREPAPAGESTAPTIALLPGSRRGEVRSLLPTMLETVPVMRKRMPGARFRLVLSPTLGESDYAPFLSSAEGVELVEPAGRYESIRDCHAAIVASGTATLELALLGVPMVIGYRLHPLSYLVARALVDVPHVGLVNLVAGERIVPERIQSEFRPEILAADLAAVVVAGAERDRVISALARAAERLGSRGAGERAARAVLEEAA